MTWEYRLLVLHNTTGDPYLAIHSVYYEEGETMPTSWSEKAQHVVADTIEEMRADLECMLKALDKPVLTVVNDRLEEA